MVNEYCDKCEPIKETDPQYETAKRLMTEQGCYKENTNLTNCLNISYQDWRLCKKETEQLTECVKNSKKNRQ